MTVEQMLEELRQGWTVAITCDGGDWTITISGRTVHSYTGRTLRRIVQAAWAGEPSRYVA